MVLAWLLSCRHPPVLESLEAPDDRSARLPLVVAVHGLGDRPESLLALVQSCQLPVRVVAPRGPDTTDGGFSWFDVTMGPEGAKLDPEGVVRSAARLAALIDELHRTRPTVGEPIITGFSQGGILSFAVALRHPHSVGTAIPIAGALPYDVVPTGLAPGPTIHALHGRDDDVVPVAMATALVQRLTDAGWSVDLTVFDDTEHTVSAEIREATCQAIAAAVN